MNKAQRKKRREKIQIQKDAEEVKRIRGLLIAYGCYYWDYSIVIEKVIQFGNNTNIPMAIWVSDSSRYHAI